jgi:hypothetical protein
MSTPDPFGAALDAQAAGAPSANDDAYGAALSRRAVGVPLRDESSRKEGEITTGPIGFINGLAEIAGKGIGNIPMAAVHGAYDLASRALGHGPQPSEPTFPLSANAQSVGQGISDAVTGAAEPYRVRAAEPFLNNYVAPVLGDVGAIAPIAGGVAGRLAKAAVASAGETRVAAQEVINNSGAGQSMGAAAATHDVEALSPQLQAAVVDAGRKTGGKVNLDALTAHAEFEQHGVEPLRGQITRDPEQFTEEQNSTHPDIIARINKQTPQLTDALDTIRRNASPTSVGNDYIENGRAAVDALKQYDEPIRADVSAKYKALADANGGSMPVDGRSFVDKADADLKAQNKARYLPPEVRSTLDDLREGGDFSFSNFENLRTDLAAASRKAERAGDGNAVGAIMLTRNALEQLPLSGKASQSGLFSAGGAGAPDAAALTQMKALADQARSAAKARFDAMDADPAYRAAVDDVSAGNKRGSPSPLADTFLDKYALSKSAPQSQVDLMMQKIKATDPEAAGAVASHALNAVRKAAISPNGNVLPSGFNGVMQKLGPKFDSLLAPETRDSLESYGRVLSRAKVEPAGGKVNYSRSGVIARDAMQTMAEGLANAKTGGTYGILKKMLNIKENAFAKDALKPGAGLDHFPTAQ